MQRNHQEEQHKKIRREWMEYEALRNARRNSGTWMDVEPYQRGWVRYYILRDDAKNRKDAREMQQVLDLINTLVFSNRENFTRRNWKTNKWEPIPQKPKYLTKSQYNELNEKHKSFFVERQWVDVTKVRGFKEKTVVVGYIFKYDEYLVFKKTPNIITQHWIPDQEIEAKYGELKTRMDRLEDEGKIHKAMNWRGGYDWDDGSNPRYRNLEGIEYDAVEDQLWNEGVYDTDWDV